MNDLVDNAPLRQAILKNDADALRRLLEVGADANSPKTKFGDAPLHTAAMQGRTEICQLLIAHGADINATNQEGETPLSEAVHQGHVAVVRLLMEAGADIHVKNKSGKGLLHWAVDSRNEEICAILLDAGLDPNGYERDGARPIFWGMQTDTGEAFNTRIVHLLVSRGADPNCTMDNGRVPLVIAVVNDNLAACRALVAAGALPGHVSPNQGKGSLTPFQWAVSLGRTELVKFFVLEAGEDLAQHTVNGRTLIQVAGQNMEMKRLIRALKTGLEIEAGIGGQQEAVATKPRRSRSPSAF